jgi:hypothetical protein
MLLQESRDVIQRLGSRTHDADGPVQKVLRSSSFDDVLSQK